MQKLGLPLIFRDAYLANKGKEVDHLQNLQTVICFRKYI